MRAAERADELRHAAGDRRLWNESYYFHFTGEYLVGYTRLGFQPYERRANLWVYLTRGEDGETVWYRNEDIPLEDCDGLHADAGGFELSHRVLEPNEQWALEGKGECGVAGDVASVFADDPDRSVPVEFDLRFRAPDHVAHQEDRGYDAHSHDKEHYSQPGRMTGSVSIGDRFHDVDAHGFRDHSWGGLRNWTPVAGGYYWFGVGFETGDSFKIAAGVRPDGTITDSFHGYHADGETVRLPEDITVEYSDDHDPEGRLHAWLDGDVSEEIAVEFELEDGTERFTLYPSGYVPMGYEDRNWEATDLDAPWLTAVINRLPVTCRWEGHEGNGWYETMHPRVRVDLGE